MFIKFDWVVLLLLIYKFYYNRLLIPTRIKRTGKEFDIYIQCNYGLYIRNSLNCENGESSFGFLKIFIIGND